ncbi:uncharacterized protein LOC136095264 [Hydra vulgaris]|uniref:uncharacterized protein LOC136095264 n=1 Tax=Hydra vulgaris TaxID=6087 RepID=UPI0032E9D140
MFLKYKITNQSMLLYYLRYDKDFLNSHSKLPSNQVNNIISKLYVRSMSLFQVIPFHKIMNRYVIDDNTLISRLTGVIISFFKKVSSSNSYPEMFFFDSIFDVLTLSDHKKITLFLIGTSNTGKSFLSQFLTSVYRNYEVGSILAPNGDRLSEFWLQQCIFTHVKRCEELVIPTMQIAQEFKKLFEGNTALLGNVKYKDNMVVPKTPIIITANGSQPSDIWKFISSEREAIINRCFIFSLNTPLKKIIQENHLSKIVEYSQQIMSRLYQIYLKRKELRRPSIKEDETLEGYLDEEATAIYL